MHYKRLARTGSLNRKYYHNKDKKCEVVKCKHKAYSKELCKTHYLYFHAALTSRLCSIPGCIKGHTAKGLCASHYGAMRLKTRIQLLYRLEEVTLGKPATNTDLQTCFTDVTKRELK